ncbi:hypothetical protein AKJ16_DCAP06650 [Drosera capensis]
MSEFIPSIQHFCLRGRFFYIISTAMSSNLGLGFRNPKFADEGFLPFDLDFRRILAVVYSKRIARRHLQQNRKELVDVRLASTTNSTFPLARSLNK